MQPRAVSVGSERVRQRALVSVFFPGLILATLLGGWLVAEQRALRLGLAAAVGLLLLGLGALTPRQLLPWLIVWLAALGMIRRIASAELSPLEDADPLLLVGPAALGLLFVTSVQAGAFQQRSRLANAVLVLGVLIFLGALNPLQGSLVAGFAGLLFVLVPTLAFWVGRSLVDENLLETILKLFGGLAIAAAAYGLVQVLSGFPSWDATWIEESGYVALEVYADTSSEGTLRPFASFASSAEYGVFLAIAVVVWVTLGRNARLLPITFAAVGFLGLALLYQSSRGIVVALVAAMVLIVCARRRLPLTAGVVAMIGVLALLPAIASRVPWTSSASTGPQELLAHQIEGVANPFDPESSTLLGHLSLLKGGLFEAFDNPLGVGVSAVTLAGDKFGSLSVGTEADPSNVAVALGIPGLLAYSVILVLAFGSTYRFASRRRDALSLAALGILTVTLLQWLNGGHYATAFLPWLLLGWLDRHSQEELRLPTDEMPRS